MFGIYRLVLALFVLISHTKGPLWIGHYAVFNFYALSGFLMTLILRENYGYHKSGGIAYLKNRWLRIFPSYYISLALTIIIACIAMLMNEELKLLPMKTLDWFVNFSIVGLTHEKVRIIGPSWSLHVEIIYYLLIPFLTRKNKHVFIWLFLSIAYTLWIWASDIAFQDRYFGVLSASLPFSMGAFLYCVTRKVKINNMCFLLGALSIWSCNIISNKFIFSYAFVDSFNFYLNTLLGVLLIFALYHFKTNETFANFDKICGDYCYPVFLLHSSIIMVGIYIFNLEIYSYGLMIFSLICTFPLSFLSINFIEKKINRKRLKIRAQQLDGLNR